jgi:hypothetical protein
MDQFNAERRAVIMESAYSRAFLAYEACRERLNELRFQQRLQIANFDPDVDDEDEVLADEYALFEQIEDAEDELRALEQDLWVLLHMCKFVSRQLFLTN